MRRLLVPLLAALAACQPEIVKWDDTRDISTSLPADSRLILNGDHATFAPAPLTAAPFTPEGACAGSIRFAAASGKPMHAVWWSLRPDGNATLLAARSDNGGVTWSTPVPVDTTDVSRAGCERIPPAIAVDPFTGYIHIAYSLQNATGSGVFFSHSMENGALYHAAVPIVFGATTTAADVAAERSRVVVAYEDPNLREQSAGRIALAISITDGHIFEHRVPVTSSGTAVRAPSVAIAGERVAVAWMDAGNRRRVRIGTLALPH